MTQNIDYSSIIFTAEQVGILGSQHLQKRRDNKGAGIPFYLKDIDEPDQDGNMLLPGYPGEVTVLLARPGNGKTGVQMRWARERAKWIKKAGIKDRIVVYISLEQTIEEINAFNIAADRRMSITKMAMGEITDDEWKDCLKHCIDRRELPLWCIGYSSETPEKQTRIDVKAITGALRLIREKHEKHIDMVMVDYLQRLPYHAESKTIGVSDNLDELKTTAMSEARAHMVISAQARREVDDMDVQIPGLDDGQWSSNIEQTGDRVMSIVRPTQYKMIGEDFGKHWIKAKTEALITVLKQKLGPANFSRWVYFDPIYNHLDRLELQK